MAREEEIKVIAYYIWEEDDCCNGRAVEHWLKAETVWEEKQKPKTVSNKPSVHFEPVSKTPPSQSKPVSKSPVKPANKIKSTGKKS
jgi:hypothetical protein